MKKTVLVAALALAFGASGAHAGVLFNPDGAPGGAATIDIGQLDWSVTSAVAVGGTQAIANFAAGSGPTTFDILTHATLVLTRDQAGVINTPTGLNNTFEITMIARFQETVTSVGPDFARFATTGAGFLELYFDSTPDSVDLTGSGFNDGTLILRGTTAQAGVRGIFSIDSTDPVQLDQSPGGPFATGFNPAVDDYGNGTPAGTQLTITGSGSQGAIPVNSLQQDFAFFLTQLDSFGITFTNISQQLPFTTVDPSDCFTQTSTGIAVGSSQAAYACDTAHADAPYSGQGAALPGGHVPVTGPVNGLFGSGPDFVFQTDFNSTVRPATPVAEPGMLALLGIALGAIGLGRRRRA